MRKVVILTERGPFFEMNKDRKGSVGWAGWLNGWLAGRLAGWLARWLGWQGWLN